MSEQFKGQRKGQALVNWFQTTYPGVEIPREVDCFYDDSLITQFNNWMVTYIQENVTREHLSD